MKKIKTEFSKKAEKLLQVHENFVRDTMKLTGAFHPMLAFSVKGNVIPVINIPDRDVARMSIEMARLMKAEWFVFMNEAYTLDVKVRGSYGKTIEEVRENYRHGDLESRFKNGDPHVIEVIIVNVFVRKEDGTYEKLGSVLDKKTLKRAGKGEFEGYLGGDN